MMTRRTPRHRALRSAALATVFAAALLAGRALPAPAQPSLVPSLRDARRDTVPLSQVDEVPEVTNAGEVSRAVAAEYPPLLRDARVHGEAQVRVVVGKDGRVTSARTVRTTHEAFGPAAERAAQRMRFRPARKRGQPVVVELTIPFSFRTDETPGAPVIGEPRPEDDDLLREQTRRGEARPLTVMALSEVDEAPELVNAREVGRALSDLYPPLLRDAGVTGVAHVRMRVGADGSVSEARVFDATHEALGAAAVRAAGRMRFRPAKKAGAAVATEIMLPVSFTLSGQQAASATPPAATSFVDGERVPSTTGDTREQ